VHQVMKRNLPSHKTTEEATFLWRIPERMNEFYEANPFLVNFFILLFCLFKTNWRWERACQALVVRCWERIYIAFLES
jgi:hypothetical protein